MIKKEKKNSARGGYIITKTDQALGNTRSKYQHGIVLPEKLEKFPSSRLE